MREWGDQVLPRGGRALAVTAAAACRSAPRNMASAPAAPSAPSADTFRVTTTADAHDADPGDGGCADAAGKCTLRAAIEEAASRPLGTQSRSACPPALPADPRHAGRRLPVRPVSITIVGTGRGSTVISAGDAFRVMWVAASDRRPRRARDHRRQRRANGFGGGVFNRGTLTITSTTVDSQPGRGRRRGRQLRRVARGDAQPDPGQRRYLGGGGSRTAACTTSPVRYWSVSSTITGNLVGERGRREFSGRMGTLLPSAWPRWHPAPLLGPPAAPRPRSRGGRAVLTVLDSNVSGNHAGGDGGGIAAEGAARVIGSVIEDNSARGAWVAGPTSACRATRISRNRAGAAAASSLPYPEQDDHRVHPGRQSRRRLRRRDRESGNVTVTGARWPETPPAAGPRRRRRGRVFEGGALVQLSDSTLAGNSTRPAGGGAINNYGGLAECRSTRSPATPGPSPEAATARPPGRSWPPAGRQPNCSVPLHETAGYNLTSDRSCGLARRPTWPAPTRSSGRWRPTADRPRRWRCCPGARPSTRAASPDLGLPADRPAGHPAVGPGLRHRRLRAARPLIPRNPDNPHRAHSSRSRSMPIFPPTPR